MFGNKSIVSHAFAALVALTPAHAHTTVLTPQIQKVVHAYTAEKMAACLAKFDTQGAPNAHSYDDPDRRYVTFDDIQCTRVSAKRAVNQSACFFFENTPNNSKDSIFRADRTQQGSIIAVEPLNYDSDEGEEFKATAEIISTRGTIYMVGAKAPVYSFPGELGDTHYFFNAEAITRRIPSEFSNFNSEELAARIGKTPPHFNGPTRLDFDAEVKAMNAAVAVCTTGKLQK
jgi:hypothetical protein